MPFVDIAYQGFGDGLEADAAGLRALLEEVPEAMIAASCSKNFGIYRERAGLLMAVAPSSGARARLQGTLATLNRMNYSFPPDHGARCVETILTDEALRADWEAELEDVRLGMLTLREGAGAGAQRAGGVGPVRLPRGASGDVLASGRDAGAGRGAAAGSRGLHGGRFAE